MQVTELVADHWNRMVGNIMYLRYAVLMNLRRLESHGGNSMRLEYAGLMNLRRFGAFLSHSGPSGCTILPTMMASVLYGRK